MKRKRNLIILFVLILLIIFMVKVVGKLDTLNTEQGNGSATLESSEEEDMPSNENNVSSNEKNSPINKDNVPSNEDNVLSNEDNESSKTASTGSNETLDTNSELIEEASTLPITKEALRHLSAGTILSVKELGDTIMDNCFYYEDIKDDIKSRIIGKSYKEDCTVPFEELKYVRVLYYGFDKETHIGELIVNKAIAADIVDIFAELYDNKYPIEQMVLVDEYDADDNSSMAADNTSSFNYRSVPGSTHLSKHALGLAIDINPLYNPYIQYTKKETIILPTQGSAYADRTLDCPYYITEDDLCYQAFSKRGFTWGGFWETEPDYQHFQKTLD